MPPFTDKVRGMFSPAGTGLLLIALAHAVLAWNGRDLRPDLSVVTRPPSVMEREALAFGDHQLLYRMWALDLQNAGDTGGRATPMRDYNYDYVVGWLWTLQRLDSRAQYTMFLAISYFALTPIQADVRRILDFVVQAVAQSPEHLWYWLAQAVPLAETRLLDMPYALELSQRLAAYDLPDMPGWILMYPAIFLEKAGRYAEAASVIENVKNTKKDRLSADDAAWAETFLQRLRTEAP